MLTKQAAQVRAKNFKKIKPSFLKIQSAIKANTTQGVLINIQRFTEDVQGIFSDTQQILVSIDTFFKTNFGALTYQTDCQPRIENTRLEIEVLQEELQALMDKTMTLIERDGDLKYLYGKLQDICTQAVNKQALTQSVEEIIQTGHKGIMGAYDRMRACFSSDASLEIE